MTELDLPTPKRLEDNTYRWDSTHERLTNAYCNGAALEMETPGGVTMVITSSATAEIYIDIDHGEQIISPEQAESLGRALISAAKVHEALRKEGLGMSEPDLIKYPSGVITATHGLDENGEQIYRINLDGDLTYLQALGMLEAAKDDLKIIYGVREGDA